MTIADLVPFWTVSAQVIPVLALAILLEARVLARSFSKKKQFQERKKRTLWGVGLFLVALMLSGAMGGAVAALLTETSREAEVSEGTLALAWAVGGSILVGLIFAFSLPLLGRPPLLGPLGM